jgi:hypothetical protein
MALVVKAFDVDGKIDRTVGMIADHKGMVWLCKVELAIVSEEKPAYREES